MVYRRKLNVLSAALAAWVGSSAVTGAVIHMEVRDLTAVADRIVIGDVTAVESYTDDGNGLIMSRVSVAVTDDLFGAGKDVVTLVLHGGTVDDLTLYTSITPVFLEGDHVLLLLRGADHGLAGAYQGAYLNDGAVAVQMQPGPPRFVEEAVRPLEALLAEIREALPPGEFPDKISSYDGPFTVQGAAAFVLNDCNWSYKVHPMGETYRVNGNCIDGGCGSPETVIDALQKGADVWNNAGGDYYFDYAGTTGAATVSFNGQNIVFWDTDGSEGMPSFAIAATFYWCSGSAMTEWDIAFNEPDFSFWDGVTGNCTGQFDIQAVGAHELGHALGLGHTGVSSATMFASTGPCSTAPRTLHSDDIAGIKFIYGEPVVTISFSDEFLDTTVDVSKWVGIDGVSSNDAGMNEPSEPYSLNLDGSPDGGNQALSSFMDLSSETDLNLEYSYQRTGGGESPEPGDDLVVEYPTSLGYWAEINGHSGDGPDMSTYEPVFLELPPGAYHDHFRLRFRVLSSDSGADDWFIDDMCVSGGVGCPAAPPPCPWDCSNDDGVVGISDFLLLLADWGGASPCDFDGDGVSITDFLILVANWGACPGPAAP
ncbi:MAG: matrixin family metalloprotease [Planctomycetota bacterium]|jgi:hypothetical protein